MNSLAFLILISLVPPIAGLPIELVVFHPEQGGWREEPLSRCETSFDGTCILHGETSPWEDGLVRGYLVVGEYGRRSILWPGGELSLQIQIESLAVEEGPYDHHSAGQNQAPVILSPRQPAWGWLGMALLVASWTAFAYRKARR
jgi:hypothetical protein